MTDCRALGTGVGVKREEGTLVAGGYGSGVVRLPGEDSEEKQPEGNQRVRW